MGISVYQLQLYGQMWFTTPTKLKLNTQIYSYIHIKYPKEYVYKSVIPTRNHRVRLSMSTTLLLLLVTVSNISKIYAVEPPPQLFYGLFPGPPGWAGARREPRDFMVQGKINRGRHTGYPAGRHSIRTKYTAHLHHPPFFYTPDALPAAQPTMSKHWMQLAHSD